MRLYRLLSTSQHELVRPNMKWRSTEYVKWSCPKCFAPILRDDQQVPDIIVDDPVLPDHGVLLFYNKVVVGVIMSDIAHAMDLRSSDVAVGKMSTPLGHVHDTHVTYVVRPSARLRLYGSRSSWQGQCKECGRLFENPVGDLSARKQHIRDRTLLGCTSGVTFYLAESAWRGIAQYHDRFVIDTIAVSE